VIGNLNEGNGMEDQLTHSIQDLCIAQHWTLSLAESCTGGFLASRLILLPHCSQYFLGSIVAYSNALKIRLLGVESTLATYGAVSGPVVGQMAQGVLKLTDSTYSLAISGIAGPGGGSLEKPVGTMWAAMANQDDDCVIWSFHLSGTRQEIIQKSTEEILSRFWLWIK
jgi:PncC family amidohydrolase